MPTARSTLAFGGINRANGIVQTNFSGHGGDFANAVVIQPDGKIVVVGNRGDSSSFDDTDMAVVRYNTNGTLDATFDGDGKKVIDLTSGLANAVALEPDGKILVGGGADSGTVNNNDNFIVARLLPNGNFDSTFGAVAAGTLNPGSPLRTGIAGVDIADSDVQGERVTAMVPCPTAKSFSPASVETT